MTCSFFLLPARHIGQSGFASNLAAALLAPEFGVGRVREGCA